MNNTPTSHNEQLPKSILAGVRTYLQVNVKYGHVFSVLEIKYNDETSLQRFILCPTRDILDTLTLFPFE